MKKLLLFLLLLLLTGCTPNKDDVTISFVTYEGHKLEDVKIGEINNLPTPSREGYLFAGWFEDPNYNTPASLQNITKKITLYAKWDEIIISFVTYEGHNLESVKWLDITELPIPTRANYQFGGWYFDEALNEQASIDNIKTSITLYAKWNVNKFTVTFKDYDGRTIQSYLLDYNGEIPTPDNPTRDGYTFTGWDKEFNKVIEDTVITALYQINTYEIKFIDNGIILKTEIVEYGKDATPPSQPTMEGRFFVRWDKSYKSIKSDLEITSLYNDWVINYNTDGGNTISPSYGIKGDKLSLPKPQKTNAVFVKWAYNDFDFDDTSTLGTETITIKAIWGTNYYSNGTTLVKYANSSNPVVMPTTYFGKEKEFRGMWVSNLTGDVTSYTSKTQMMNQLTTLLNNMEAWNMNALVYHIRIMNDALYPSANNPISTYVENANFEEWDYLEWLIDECHKRGIEFHAWLNPYRISNSMTLQQVLSKYADFPNNPASKSENIIINGKASILNPGEPAVRQFLIDTCMEVIEKYDVDAIHFDDYFYISMSSLADAATYNKYKHNSQTTNIEDWRREQVDIFIRDLSITMRTYNQETNRTVELGISPSGIYRNGNGIVTYDSKGTAITNGSNTGGMEHYKGYLYSDTKKWIDEEWIDYICPQSYWGFTHPIAGYADVVDWWAKVVKYKNVKLYTGMGIYMTEYSWGTNPKEASDQVLYNTKYSEIQGVCIFRYNYFVKLLNENNQGVKIILNEYWTTKVSVPE